MCVYYIRAALEILLSCLHVPVHNVGRDTCVPVYLHLCTVPVPGTKQKSNLIDR